MTTRRHFLRAGVAGALAALGDVRALFADELARFGPARPEPPANPERSLGHGGVRLPSFEDYLVDPEVYYLNHGSIGTIPRLVQRAHTEYLRICETNPWLYMWDEPWVEPLEEVRLRAARALGCSPDEVAITHNTTEGFNTLAHGLPLEVGDEVLFSSLNHPGAANPWIHQALLRGYSVRSFDFPVEELPGMTVDEVVDIHLREIRTETRVLVFPHVDNLVGLRHPIREIAEGAKARGVEYVAVDGAQALSMIPTEVAPSGVDFYAASPHKWVQSPKGLGLLYLAERLHDQVAPLWVSSGMGSNAGTVRRFEDYGTRNRPEVLALGDALAFQEAVGMPAKEAHHRREWERARERVEATPGFRWRSPTRWELAAPLYLVEVQGTSATPLSRRLWEEGGIVYRPIRVTRGIEGARISPNLQNRPEELEIFFRAAESASPR